MAHDEQRACVVDKLRFEQFHVSISSRSWAVEDEYVRGSREQYGQQQPVALAARQGLHLRSRALRRKTKSRDTIDVTADAADRHGSPPSATVSTTVRRDRVARAVDRSMRSRVRPAVDLA